MRGVSIIISFLLIPLTLNYLSPVKYGVWLTLLSLINWVSALDVGLGTGLRNKFAEAIAKNDDELARTYVSTAYFFIALIVIAALIIFLSINPFLVWSKILNTGSEMESELTLLAGVAFTFFCFRLVFSIIGTILTSDQQPASSAFLEVLTNFLSLIVIYVLTKITDGSLFWIGFTISSIAGVVPLGANIWFFSKKYKRYLPSLLYVKKKYAKALLSLGIQFFIIQLASILIFSSSNIIITQFFGPEEVTLFNIAFRYYGVASMAFLMIITPFWSAYTDAFSRNDRGWIARSNKKLIKVWLLLLAAVFMMTIFSDYIYKIWVGNAIQIPWLLSAIMAINVLIIAWCNIFAYFMNGTGKIRLQMWAALLVAVTNIFLSLAIVTYTELKSGGVILATCISLLPWCFIWPIQMKKILNGTATGIWNK